MKAKAGTLAVLISVFSALSASAFSSLGPLPVYHDWTVHGYGIQDVGGNTCLMAGYNHCLFLRVPFSVTIGGTGLLIGAVLFGFVWLPRVSKV